MADFTKWEVNKVKTFEGKEIYAIHTYPEPTRIQRVADVFTGTNAHLIAAAPDMYEALESWEELWNMRPLDSGADMQEILERCWAKTDKALAKAEGRE